MSSAHGRYLSSEHRQDRFVTITLCESDPDPELTRRATGPLAVWERSPQLRARGDREPPVARLEPLAVVEIPRNWLHRDGRRIYLRYGERSVARVAGHGERMLARARADHAPCLSRGGRPRAARATGRGSGRQFANLRPLAG